MRQPGLRLKAASVCGLLLWLNCSVAAQDTRAQYPRLLANSYFGIHAGYIDYPFSNAQVEQGGVEGLLKTLAARNSQSGGK